MDTESFRFTDYSGDQFTRECRSIGQAIGIVDSDAAVAYVTDLEGNFVHGDLDFYQR
jgi:hypothetical protein